ncbi:MAG TPA: hypothetical protein DDZ51_18210 [Planctomycetaceae bacterium]|nr:hypothetical protein [Planctomycetaceae bacterium]
MPRYRLTATPLDPITQRKSRQSQVSAGLTSISGTTLRGALAKEFIDLYGDGDARFGELFLDEDATRFGTLTPWPRSIPLTATSCKRFPGFADDQPRGHGVIDQLWMRVAEQVSGGPLSAAQLDLWLYCQSPLEAGGRCGAAMKPFSGGWQWDEDSSTATTHKKPAALVNAHVGIDRATGTASPSIFYTLCAIDAPQQAWLGYVDATPHSRTQLDELLQRSHGRIRVGHAKTRGYGRIQLQLDEQADDNSANDQTAAWTRWSDSLRQFLGQTLAPKQTQAYENCTFFSLTFPAGAIFVDSFLRYSLDPATTTTWLPGLREVDAETLWRNLESLPEAMLTNVTAVTRHELVRGWNAAHGLPRQDDYAVAAGAVYVYAYRGDPAWLWAQLQAIQTSAIGLRRNEGFGQVLVCDPFHQLFAPTTFVSTEIPA